MIDPGGAMKRQMKIAIYKGKMRENGKASPNERDFRHKTAENGRKRDENGPGQSMT